MNNYDIVERAYNELVAERKVFPSQEYEEHKALITRRAAYYLNSQIDSGYGLLRKTSGNNVMGLSVDWIVNKNTNWGGDIATDVDSGNGLRLAKIQNPNGESWNDYSKWVQPTKELAGLDSIPDNPPPSEPPSTEPIPTLIELFNDIQERLKIIESKVSTPPTYEGRISIPFLGSSNITLTPRK